MRKWLLFFKVIGFVIGALVAVGVANVLIVSPGTQIGKVRLVGISLTELFVIGGCYWVLWGILNASVDGIKATVKSFFGSGGEPGSWDTIRYPDEASTARESWKVHDNILVANDFRRGYEAGRLSRTT